MDGQSIRHDAIVVKYNKSGSRLWAKKHGGDKRDTFNDIIETENEELVAVGYTYATDIEGNVNKGSSDTYVVKMDKNGNIIWQQLYGGSNNDEFNKIIETSRGDFVIVGTTKSTDIEGITYKGGWDDAYIVKIDKDGNIKWQQNYGGSGGTFLFEQREQFNDIIELNDGTYLVVGTSYSTDIEGLPSKGYSDGIVVVYDSDGKRQWHNNYGGSDYDSIYGITLLGEKYLAVGRAGSTDIEGVINKGSLDGLIVKLSTIYDITTEETTNGTFEVTQEGYRARIMFTSEKGYELDEIIVTDSKGNKVEYYEEDGNYYVDLTDDVTVNVTFRKETILDIINPDTGVMQVVDIIVIIGLILGGVFYFRRKKNYI